MTGLAQILAAALGGSKIARWGLLALAGLLAGWAIYAGIAKRGADQARAEIERQNNAAGIKGGEARLSRGDCVRCGGMWDFRAGKCTGPAGCDR